MKTKFKTLRGSGEDFKKVLLELDGETRALLEEAIEAHTDEYEELNIKHVPTKPYIINKAIKALLNK